MSLSEIKELVFNKYGENKINFYHILKSFFCFEDVEDSPDPVSLNHTKWNDIKDYLISNEKKFTETLLG